jgi:hypothetical protein
MGMFLDETQPKPIGMATQAAEGEKRVEAVKAGIGCQGHGHAFLPGWLRDCVL